jgi:hypothetical protein
VEDPLPALLHANKLGEGEALPAEALWRVNSGGKNKEKE